MNIEKDANCLIALDAVLRSNLGRQDYEMASHILDDIDRILDSMKRGLIATRIGVDFMLKKES